ncbi:MULTISPECIES: hypothetical protein [Pseudomonas]|uniref:hypothetical protein n=1 Tax=Pseudomonas TaxID=286 RepID=UPI0013D73100|nr:MULTISPECIES: hypothetical protein [Pseudomonas]MDN3223628.1 hypothetical protein [Pseudomonas nunensis]
MKQPRYYTLRRLVAFTLDHFKQRRGSRGDQPVKPLQPFTNMLANLRAGRRAAPLFNDEVLAI